MVQYACPKCRKELQVEWSGAQGKCAHCGHAIRGPEDAVPLPETPAGPVRISGEPVVPPYQPDPGRGFRPNKAVLRGALFGAMAGALAVGIALGDKDVIQNMLLWGGIGGLACVMLVVVLELVGLAEKTPVLGLPLPVGFLIGELLALPIIADEQLLLFAGTGAVVGALLGGLAGGKIGVLMFRS